MPEYQYDMMSSNLNSRKKAQSSEKLSLFS
jgi:hypothetical protein